MANHRSLSRPPSVARSSSSMQVPRKFACQTALHQTVTWCDPDDASVFDNAEPFRLSAHATDLDGKIPGRPRNVAISNMILGSFCVLFENEPQIWEVDCEKVKFPMPQESQTGKSRLLWSGCPTCCRVGNTVTQHN